MSIRVWVGRLFGKHDGLAARQPYVPDSDTREARLLRLVYSRLKVPPAEAARAEAALRSEVKAVPMSEWPRVDEVLRGWLDLRAFEYGGQLTLPPPVESAAYGLLACHRDGFVRESVVRKLAERRDGGELVPLLLRANDWVPQVHTVAIAALQARLTPEYVPHWARALALVAWLRRTGRANNAPLVEAVFALLSSGPARTAVRDALYAIDDDVRGLRAAILFSGVGPGDLALVIEGLGNADPHVRIAAAEAAARLDDEGIRHVLPLLHADPLPRIRALGIRLTVERIGRAGIEVLRRALLDRSAAVSAEARRGITALEPMDFAAFYRERMHGDQPGLARVIEGLRDTGDPSDATLVRPFVDHPLPRVRAAALRALDRFGDEGAEDFLILAVADPNRRVSSTAAKLLLPGVAKVAPSELAALFSADLPPWTRRNALSLLASRGQWIALPWLVRATADPDETIAVYAGVLLRRWRDRFNRGFTQPTPEQRAEAVAALDGYVDRDPVRRRTSSGEKGNPPMREWLQNILKAGG
ncbi:MAG TPA: HEAT repeat domain-containing protein [Longimicrobium sp.]|jgi:HEAT repeat protein|uniref:HEAT repeat domain-containing protein n=1 Tax=Longimicrobium sp. TaxID=2029185 RepID=UPI002ED91002